MSTPIPNHAESKIEGRHLTPSNTNSYTWRGLKLRRTCDSENPTHQLGPTDWRRGSLAWTQQNRECGGASWKFVRGRL